MNKDVNITVIFQGKRDLFQCPRSKFLDGVIKHYNINAKDIDVYAIEKNSKRLISPNKVSDLMTVEIVQKGMAQRSVYSYFGGESSKTESYAEKLMAKLKNNAILTGQDRKYLMEMLLNYSSSSLGKRKHDDMNGPKKPKMINKKVQANPTSQFYKESVAQTDQVFLTSEVVNANRDETITKIKELAANSERNEEEINKLMTASFDDRRNFILIESPLIALLKHKYPLLFCTQEIKNELERLFYVGKCDAFIANIDKYSNVILDCCDKSNTIYQRTMKSLDCCHTVKQQKYCKAVGSILALPSLMNENLLFLNTSDNNGKSGVYPYIDASLHSLKAVFFDNMLFKIYSEKQLVCEATNFREALLCLMASFYIFNIDYTEGCENTLAVFEKLYLCANDTVDIDPNAEQLIKLFRLKTSS